MTPGGQIVNIEVTAPSFAFLFGGTLRLPFPGSLSFPLPSPAPLTAAAQFVVIDATHPDGPVLSSGVDYIVQ